MSDSLALILTDAEHLKVYKQFIFVVWFRFCICDGLAIRFNSTNHYLNW